MREAPIWCLALSGSTEDDCTAGGSLYERQEAAQGRQALAMVAQSVSRCKYHWIQNRDVIRKIVKSYRIGKILVSFL